MSELAPWPLAELAGSPEFRSDARFAPPQAVLSDDSAAHAEAETEDPLAIAWQRGFAAGLAETEVRAKAEAEASDAARELLTLGFGRLDGEMAETLRQRLHDTVVALCEAALAPMTIDSDALIRRIERAVALLQRAGDDQTIRLNPADIALISGKCRDEWRFTPDTSLPRGAMRIETSDGGVEDGPAQWRQAIAEALQ